jgi:tetratricopeptide (TPR) repeat protein
MDDLSGDSFSGSDFAEDKVKDVKGFGGTPFLNAPKLGLSSAMLQFITIFVGVAIGLAVMAFLIMPSAVKDEERLRITAEAQVVVLEESKTALEKQVIQLESSLDEAKSSSDKSSNDYKYSQLQLQEVSKMIKALDSFVADDLNETVNNLYLIDPTYLNVEALDIHTELTTPLYPEVAESAWKKGYNDYRNGKYESSIENLELSYKFEQAGYYSDETLYYLGRCYYKLSDDEKALSLFEKLLETYPEADNKKDAEYYVNVIKGN